MKKRTFVVIRWCLGVGAFAVAYWYLSHLSKASAEIELPLGFHHGIIGLIGLLAGVILLSPELVDWASYPLRYAFNSLLFPGGTERPPPNYNLTRVYREQERYGEALEQYFQIIRNHPQELLAYIEGIETAFESGAPKVAQKICRMASKRLQSKEAREHVQSAYAACLQQANEPAEATQEVEGVEATGAEPGVPLAEEAPVAREKEGESTQA